MSNSWFRFYNEVVDDHKVQRLNPITFRAWVNLMCLASKNDGPLPKIDEIAYKLRITQMRASQFILELKDAGLIDQIEGVLWMHNWNGRQFKSDTSRERTAKWRANSHSDGKCDVTRDNAETPPDTDTEQKQIQTQIQSAFADVWRDYPNPVKRKEAERHFNASVKTLADLANIRSALANYIEQRNYENAQRKEHGERAIPWQNGSTWFNNWRDWTPKVDASPAHPIHRCEFCSDAHEWMCKDVSDCTLDVIAACPEFISIRRRAVNA